MLSISTVLLELGTLNMFSVFDKLKVVSRANKLHMFYRFTIVVFFKLLHVAITETACARMSIATHLPTEILRHVFSETSMCAYHSCIPSSTVKWQNSVATICPPREQPCTDHYFVPFMNWLSVASSPTRAFSRPCFGIPPSPPGTYQFLMQLPV